MALVAGRIAFGARASQPSFPADASPMHMTLVLMWEARNERKGNGLATCGRRGATIRPAG
ncbi:MAG: hypothetical protein IJT64_03535 [Kiritimatiellae bacterium]|nr:hypothetical protein [Kiritimatiellia bacterium]